MASRLYNTLMFTGLVVGVPVMIDHELNIDGRPIVPDFVAPALGPFDVTSNASVVTVIRTVNSPGPNVDVWVAHLHTILRVFGMNGAFQPDGLSVRPFILNQAGGGPGGGLSDLSVWGNDNLRSPAETVFLTPGRGLGNASTSPDFTFNAPRAGVFQNLYARHNRSGGNGNLVDYRLRVNGIDTALTVSLATGAIGGASNLVAAVAVSAGDLLDLVCVKASAIGGGNTDTQISVEYV